MLSELSFLKKAVLTWLMAPVTFGNHNFMCMSLVQLLCVYTIMLKDVKLSVYIKFPPLSDSGVIPAIP